MRSPTAAPAAARADRRFFATDAETLARRLLGQRLVRVLEDGTRLAGVIVETEAYLGERDAAAHSYGGRRTPRTEPMFGPPGTSYVYFTYGMHHCMNISAGREGEPVAVLIRALEPIEGVERMRALRAGATSEKPLAVQALANGPGRLCQALAIDRTLSGLDMTRSEVLFVERIRRRSLSEWQLVNTPRIGVDGAGAWAHRLLRWYIRGHPCVSRR